MRLLLPLMLPLLSACAVTGQSVGVTHGLSVHGDGGYHAPHYTVETEKLDVGVQYYHFTDREEIDFLEADWTVKF